MRRLAAIQEGTLVRVSRRVKFIGGRAAVVVRPGSRMEAGRVVVHLSLPGKDDRPSRMAAFNVARAAVRAIKCAKR